MSMQTAKGEVAEWFTQLPLSDPRCNNDSCIAYEEAHAASQAAVSYSAQFFYGHYTLWIFAVVLGLASIHFYLQTFLGQKQLEKDDDGPGIWDKITASVRWISYRRMRGRIAESFAVPSLGVGIVILMSWIACSIMAFARHPYYRERRGYGSPPLGVRTGLMAFALVPITFATAGKVNLITYLTGLGHEKLNAYHRWMGYLMLYVSVIHTIPFIVQPLREGGAAFLRQRFYRPGGLEYNGTPPLGMLVGLAVLSLPPLRRKAYELFVHVHILLAIVYLGLLFWHAGDLGDSWAYLWATLGIFLFQILVRIFGKTSTFQLRGDWFDQAPVTLTDVGENMVRLELEVQGLWRWEPGQHVFLRFATLRPLDNHPFTIASLPKEKHALDDSQRMVFYIRPQRGLTKRTSRLVELGKTANVTVDGPYGTVIRPKVGMRYDTALLIAGGGGISGVLPWLEHFCRGMADNTCVTRSVTLVWVMRSQASLSWVSDELKAITRTAALGSVKVELWITAAAAEQKPSRFASEGKEADTGVHQVGGTPSEFESETLATAYYGQRPHIPDVLNRYSSKGRVIVLGCGPESLKIDLSNAVAAAQKSVFQGKAREVRLHTETFGW